MVEYEQDISEGSSPSGDLGNQGCPGRQFDKEMDCSERWALGCLRLVPHTLGLHLWFKLACLTGYPSLRGHSILILCFHRSRPSTAGRIRHWGLILAVFGARFTSGSAVSGRFCLTTALNTSSQVTAGRPRSPAVTVRLIGDYLRLSTD